MINCQRCGRLMELTGVDWNRGEATCDQCLDEIRKDKARRREADEEDEDDSTT